MKQWLSPFLFIFIIACSSSKHSTTVSSSSSSVVVDGKLWASLYQQRAGEYKALCLQAFNMAKLRIDELSKQIPIRARAIVTDIDETFLDNSPYAVHQSLQNKDYEAATWMEWTAKGQADTLSGALDFFRYASSKGFTIYYITNREEAERKGTLQNLQNFGFPQADNDHLIMRQTVSSKETRRQQVAAKYDIVMLLGDNLADFSAVFDKRTTEDRNAQVQAMRDEFGKKFIVLPNPGYGGWEDAIYQNKREWTAAQKDSLVRSAVKNY